MLLDKTDLVISAAGMAELRAAGSNENSIRMHTSILPPRNPNFDAIPAVALVDSGCTAMAFADATALVQKYEIPVKPLQRPKPLRLADGVPSSLITHYFTARMQVGLHEEPILFYVTKLAAATPVILGMPWLRTHDPKVVWSTPSLTFDSTYCLTRCITTRVPMSAPLISSTDEPPAVRKTTFHRTTHRPPHVEEVPDEGEPVVDQTPPSAKDRLSTTTETKGLTSPPAKHKVKRMTKRVTFATETRMVEITEIDKRLRRPLPVPMLAGRRLKVCLKRPSAQRRQPPFVPKEAERPNMEDIRAVRAVNFVQFCKQKDVRVMRIHMSKLIELADIVDEHLPPENQLLPIPDISEESFRRLVEGEYTLQEATKVFPSYFHDFLKSNLEAGSESLMRKILDEDVEKFMKGKPPLSKEDILQRLPKEFHDLFEAFLPRNADELPPHRPWDHKIELIPGKVPPNARNRPLSPKELRCVKKWIDEMLEKGFIRESTSPAAAPLLLAAKPGGGVRICHDYRGLNEITVKNRYPLPLIRETLDNLCGAKYYTKLDVIAAFNRIRVAEGHEWMTAFITRFGLYEMLVTPFGLCNAPATFQNYINHVLHDALDLYCTAYLDDVLVFSRTREEHTRHVHDVIRRLRDAGLQIDMNKSEFYTKKTKYLGLIISTEGMSMDKDKITAITAWQTPTSIKELQQFLGFANFYRRFIQGY
jgi:hypothetical protein